MSFCTSTLFQVIIRIRSRNSLSRSPERLLETNSGNTLKGRTIRSLFWPIWMCFELVLNSCLWEEGRSPATLFSIRTKHANSLSFGSWPHNNCNLTVPLLWPGPAPAPTSTCLLFPFFLHFFFHSAEASYIPTKTLDIIACIFSSSCQETYLI